MHWECELINWFISWLVCWVIDCLSLYWFGIGGVDFWCAQGIRGFDVRCMVVVVRLWMEPKVDFSDSFFLRWLLFMHKNEMDFMIFFLPRHVLRSGELLPAYLTGILIVVLLGPGTVQRSDVTFDWYSSFFIFAYNCKSLLSFKGGGG